LTPALAAAAWECEVKWGVVVGVMIATWWIERRAFRGEFDLLGVFEQLLSI
jgi:hypothetical protein